MKVFNANFDIIKIILCLMVVGIHTLGYPWLFPTVRIAVPLFFVISSYFLFSKLKNVDKIRQNKVLAGYILRNLYLYVFWFIALFPITAKVRSYWKLSLLGIIKTIIKHSLLGSTFIVSWFISATIVATLMVYLCARIFTDKSIMLFGLFLNSFCVLFSSYRPFLPQIEHIIECYYRILLNPCFSFPVAIYWIILGKIFAEGHRLSKKQSIIGTLISLILLIIEWRIVYWATGKFDNDCYFMLMPLGYFLFAWILRLKPIYSNKLSQFRKITVIVYAFHASAAWVIRRYLSWSGYRLFFTTIVICAIIGIGMLQAEKYKFFSWLKYSH